MIYNSFDAYLSWLKSKNYSQATIRNYIVDLEKYKRFVNDNNSSDIFSSNIISQYLTHLSGNNNSGRYLASLNLYCQFAVDQHLIDVNPLKKIRKQNNKKPKISLASLVRSYELHLSKHNTPQSTVRNYINDLNQYISWLNNQKLGLQ